MVDIEAKEKKKIVKKNKVIKVLDTNKSIDYNYLSSNKDIFFFYCNLLDNKLYLYACNEITQEIDIIGRIENANKLSDNIIRKLLSGSFDIFFIPPTTLEIPFKVVGDKVMIDDDENSDCFTIDKSNHGIRIVL